MTPDNTTDSGARMVDVSAKDKTLRTAKAAGTVTVTEETMAVIQSGSNKKGDVLEVARVAGIMAAKNTPQILPLCHPIALSSIKVDIAITTATQLTVTATAKAHDVTGVEMEALTATAAAALCIYDMCKYLDKGIVVSDIRLLDKTGGKSGDYHREEA